MQSKYYFRGRTMVMGYICELQGTAHFSVAGSPQHELDFYVVMYVLVLVWRRSEDNGHLQHFAFIALC